VSHPSSGADDLLPRLCFVLVQSQIADLPSELALLEECMPTESKNGEDGYALTTFRLAAEGVMDARAMLPCM
jgi:hypothetical protein